MRISKRIEYAVSKTLLTIEFFKDHLIRADLGKNERKIKSLNGCLCS